MGQYNSVGYVVVEPRLIYAPLGCIWVGQRLYTGRLSVRMQSEGRFYTVGKGFVAVEEYFDCNRIPTYGIGSSEDHTGCRSTLIICSREIVYGYTDILYGRTNHYHG